MRAYGAELIIVEGNMELARDMAMQMQAAGEGIVLNQFGNMDNPLGHYLTTGTLSVTFKQVVRAKYLSLIISFWIWISIC